MVAAMILRDAIRQREDALVKDFDELTTGLDLPPAACSRNALLPALPRIGEKLPLDGLQSGTKRGIFTAYSNCREKLDVMRQDAGRFLLNVIKTNTIWINTDDGRKQPIPIDEVAKNFEGATQDVSADFIRLSNPEIASRPIPELQEIMLTGVRDSAAHLLKRINVEMIRGVRNQQIGTIERFPDSVCRYTYYRNRISDAVTGTSQSRNQQGRIVTRTNTTHKERRFRHSTIKHTLIEAKETPVPAKQVPQPKAVSDLIKQAPGWLKGMMSVVTGFQINEERHDREAVVDRWDESSTQIEVLPPVITERVRFDPALTLGPYVLVGWDDAEVL